MVSVGVLPTGLGKNPHWSSEFFPKRGGLFGRHNPSPVVCRAFPLGVAIGEAEQIRRAIFGIAGATRLGDLYELERDQFPDGWRDEMAIDSIAPKVVISDGQSPIVSSAVMREFDLDPIKHTSGG
jgi:hypothetical protein